MIPMEFACPKCGQLTRIKRTIGPKRHRHCLHCGQSFTTHEISDDDYTFLMAMERYAAQLKRRRASTALRR